MEKPSEEEIRDRHRKQKDEDIRVAESAIARIQETGTDGIRGVALFRNSFELVVKAGKHDNRIPMDELPEGGIVLTVPRDGIATITCPPPTGRPPHPDSKWVRRPVSHAVAQGIVERLVGTFEDVSSGGKSDDDIPKEKAHGVILRWAPMIVIIEFEGDDEATCYQFSGHSLVFAGLIDDIKHAFDAVTIPNHLRRDELTHLENLSFTALPNTTFGYESISFVREPDGTGARLRYRTTRQLLTDKPAMDVHLTEEDWQSFLDAVHDTDFPSWGASYRDGRLRHDSDWDASSKLNVSFDDGWLLHVHGWKLFDPRFVSIVREVYRHGRQTRDEDKILAFWETKEADVQTALEDARRSEKGKETRLWLSAQERGADAVEAWNGLAGIVRMRAMQEGLLVEGITIKKEPWDHEMDLFLSEIDNAPRMLRPHGARIRDDESSEASLSREPEPDSMEAPYAYDEQDEGFVSDFDSNDGDVTDGCENRDNTDDFVYDDTPAFPKAASIGDGNEMTDDLETADKPETTDEQEQADKPRTEDEAEQARKPEGKSGLDVTASAKTTPDDRTSDAVYGNDSLLIKAITRGYIVLDSMMRRIRVARSNWQHMAETVSDARSDRTSGYVATCVVRPIRPFPRNQEESDVRAKSVSIETTMDRTSSLSATYRCRLSRDSNASGIGRIMAILADMGDVRWNDPSDAVRWGCQLGEFDDSLKLVSRYLEERACIITVIWEDESVSFVSMSDSVPPSVLEACGKIASEMAQWAERR